MFPGGWPKTGSRRSAVLRFAITNGPRAAKIEWNSFPEHCGRGNFFYVNSGGLRAGKGPATLREASRLPVYNFWWIIAATCDLAAAAPKSAPGRIQGAHGMDRTRVKIPESSDFLGKIMRKNK
jgi:hypothetical protein